MNCCKNKKDSLDKSCCDKEESVVEKESEPVEEKNADDSVKVHDNLDENTRTSIRLRDTVIFWKRISVTLSLVLVVSLTVQIAGMPFVHNLGKSNIIPIAYASEVLPEDGVVLPITWGDLGKRMVEAGVIDSKKFEMLYERRGGMSDETKSLLYGENTENITLTAENSGELLNLLWAFGLSNKSSILETGLMTSYDGKEAGSKDEAKKKAGNMAATGGWPLSVGNPMDHYSAHEFVTLTSSEWELVEEVASGIYRPCCNNPSHFPDCNHGMAMLGLLELLADEGLTESEMFDIALSVNSFWFPDTYITIAEYMDINGVSWDEVDSKKVLGPQYSSGSGFASVRSVIVEPVQTGSGGGCGA